MALRSAALESDADMPLHTASASPPWLRGRQSCRLRAVLHGQWQETGVETRKAIGEKSRAEDLMLARTLCTEPL